MIVTSENPLQQEFSNQIKRMLDAGMTLTGVTHYEDEDVITFNNSMRIKKDNVTRHIRIGTPVAVTLIDGGKKYETKRLYIVKNGETGYKAKPSVYAESSREFNRVADVREQRCGNRAGQHMRAKTKAKKSRTSIKLIDHDKPSCVNVSPRTYEQFAEFIRSKNLKGFKTFDAKQITRIVRLPNCCRNGVRYVIHYRNKKNNPCWASISSYFNGSTVIDFSRKY